MNSYRRGLQIGVLVNPNLFILEKFNFGPHINCWSNLVKLSQIWSNLIKLGQTRCKLILFGTGHYTMHYALFTIHYALCTIYYALCTMHYVLCIIHYAYVFVRIHTYLLFYTYSYVFTISRGNPVKSSDFGTHA